MTKDREAKVYTVVSNPHHERVSISHDDPQVTALSLGPYEARVVDPEQWNEDVDNLRRAIGAGDVVMEETTARPKQIPGPPADMPRRPIEMAAVRQIVFQAEEELALDIVNMEPVRENMAGEPIDVDHLKTRHVPVLRAALQWLEAWDRPDRAGRMKRIKERLDEIHEM